MAKNEKIVLNESVESQRHRMPYRPNPFFNSSHEMP